MRLLFILFLVLSLALSACSSADRAGTSEHSTASAPAGAGVARVGPAGAPGQAGSGASTINVSAQQTNAAAVERKIIRNAELTLESEAPEESFRKVASLAESRGGFVVTSESTRDDDGEAQGRVTVRVTVRVPSAQFEAVVEEIRKTGSRVLQDRRAGQDVTEEFIDLEARIRAKKALEAQFLEIMKQAEKVSDALEVQRQLAEVRAEIEQVEGRRRFLENQSSLSTINVTIRPPVALVLASRGGFVSGVKEAVSEGIQIATFLVLVFIRLLIILVPVLLFVGLPAVWLWRAVSRRSKRLKVS